MNRSEVGAAPSSLPDAALPRPRDERAVSRLVSHLVERHLFDPSILDGVDLGIVTTDGAGRITFANRAVRDVLGAPHDVRGAEVVDLLALPEPPAALVADATVRRFPHVVAGGDGEVEIDLAVSRIEEPEGGFLFVFHDRTHERQREIERQRLERLAAMGTMVAGFAHEIRNPVASLRSLAESLGDDLADAGLHFPHVERMLAVLGRMERLVRASLLFGSPTPPRLAPHDPWALAAHAIAAVRPRVGDRGPDITLERVRDLPDVFVDDGQVIQILVILLNNALDATASAARVSVRVELARPPRPADGNARRSEPTAVFVRIAVRDEGPGIDPEIIGRIFDPFFTTKGNGTGLGLSIAQQLVADNAGRLDVTSSLGGPTTFQVLLPLAGLDAPP